MITNCNVHKSFFFIIISILISNNVYAENRNRLNIVTAPCSTLNSPATNTIFGQNAGIGITVGVANSFFGHSAGESTSNCSGNSYFGALAGSVITEGEFNSFFGYRAGGSSFVGSRNTFFGSFAGTFNEGDDNSTFGNRSGLINKGNGNSFFGQNTGTINEGDNNAFVGVNSGISNSTGFDNVFFGSNAGLSNTTGSSNVFIGRKSGNDNATGIKNTFVGKKAGQNNFGGEKNTFFGHKAGLANTSGSNNTIIGTSADVGSNNLQFATAIGSKATVDTSNTIQLGRTNGFDSVNVSGVLAARRGIIVNNLDTAGSIPLCLNTSTIRLASCSSSLRYKSNIETFHLGLNIINQLRPVSFNWRGGGVLDFGLIAEEVAKIEPLLVTTNAIGKVEGVKYDRIGVVLINALKEQQKQIEAQTKENKTLRKELNQQKNDLKLYRSKLEKLTVAICSQSKDLPICD